MSNEVEIHVKVTDDGKANLDKIKATYTAAGKETGAATGKAINEGVKKTQFEPAKIKAEDPIDASWRRHVEESLKASKTAPLKVQAVDPIDAAWRAKLQASLKAMAKDSLKIPMEPDTEKYRAQLHLALGELSSAVKQNIPVDMAGATQFKLHVEELAREVSAEVKAKIPVEVDEQKLNESVAKVDGEIKQVAQNANGQFSALAFAGLAVGLPAAAAIGAAGAGLALAVVPLLFAGVAVAALKSNQDVKTAFTDMVTHVKTSTADMAAPLTGTLVDAAGQVGATFDHLSPLIGRTMVDSKASVLQLTGAVNDFASGAMPGMLFAVDASKGPLDGLRSLAGQTGAGLSDMFANLAGGSHGAQQGMTDLGGIVRNLEGFIGTLLANLANGSHAILPQFSGALSQVESIIGTLTSGGGGMPALQGAASSFLGTISGGLAIVQGLASGLGGWAGPLGQAAGAFGATNTIAKMFGTNIGATGAGIGAFTAKLDEAGNKTTPFKEALAGATGVGQKLSAGLGSIASSGFNPLGVALIGGGLLLDLWGKHAQEAAQRAAENKQVVNDLTQAYIKDGQAVGANTQAAIAKDAADKNLTANAAAAGISLPTWTSALIGDTAARKQATQTALDHGKAIIFAGNGTAQAKQQMFDEYTQIVQNGGSIADLTSKYSAWRDKQNDLTASQKQSLEVNGNAGQAINMIASDLSKAAQSSADLTSAQDKLSSQVSRATTPAMYAAEVAAGALTGAFATLNTAGGNVVAKGQALITVLRTLAGEKPSVEDALNTWNTDLLAINTTLKGDNLKQHTKDLIDNTGAVNTATKAGGDLYGVVTKQANDFAAYAQSLKDSGSSAAEMSTKLGTMRNAFINQMTAMGLTAAQAKVLADHYGLIPDKIVTQLSLEGDKETQAQITDLTTKLKEIPAGKSVFVQALTDKAIEALGNVGDTVVKMPNGTFNVFANTAPGKAAADLLLHEVGTSNATATVYADTAPAGQAVTDWAHTTASVKGNTTTYTDTNPASGQVRTWKVTTDATGAKTVTYTNTDPAAGQVGEWKRNTDGTWAQVNVRADTDAANNAIDNAARPRTSVIRIVTQGGYANVGINSGMAHSMQAKGSIQGPNMMFAGGGLPTPNGANNMSGIAQIVHPGTLKWAGDAKVPEAYIPLDHSARSMDLLASANRMMAPSSAALGGSSGGAGGGGGGGSANVQISFGLSGVDYIDAIITDIAKSVRSKGGNVQVVLGGSS
jgi:hypothetical protein